MLRRQRSILRTSEAISRFYAIKQRKEPQEAPDAILCFLWFLLKRVLQRELHDSRIARKSEYTEELIVLSRAGILRTEAVRHVVGFRTELHALRFPYLEATG